MCDGFDSRAVVWSVYHAAKEKGVLSFPSSLFITFTNRLKRNIADSPDGWKSAVYCDVSDDAIDSIHYRYSHVISLQNGICKYNTNEQDAIDQGYYAVLNVYSEKT